PRPQNAWILYRSEQFQLLMQEYEKDPDMPRPTQAEVSKLLGARWKEASEEVRAHYNKLALLEKDEHMAMYPGYQYKPIKRQVK
ncbi:hypothetical protein M422DRAFT_91926, partial [Sphaerobolus stellatus SS14]